MRGDCGRVKLVLDYSEAGTVALFLTAACSELHPKFGPVGVPPLKQGRRPPPSLSPRQDVHATFMGKKARPRFSPEPVWLDEWTLYPDNRSAGWNHTSISAFLSSD